MIVLIDNYDSFSYNLYQMVGALNPNITVIRNDQMSVEEIASLNPQHIILSPGPGRPEDAGVTATIVTTLAKHVPTLGVCLGHQAICQVFGATITYAPVLMHGKQSDVTFDTTSELFAGMDQTAPVARYHSLIADPHTIPDALAVTARTESGEVMAVQHRHYPIFGVQFHPESILTPGGQQMVANFLAVQHSQPVESHSARTP